MLPTCKQLYYAFTFTLIIQEILIKIKYVYRPDYVFIAQYMFWYICWSKVMCWSDGTK